MSHESKEPTFLPDRLMYFLPEEILTDEEINVRPFSTKTGDTDEEIAAIQEMAKSLESGQVQPVEVYLDQDGKPHLIAGHRRRKGAMLLNMGRGEKEVQFQLSCLVKSGINAKQAHRDAMIENLHRKGISAMDLAYDFAAFRKEHGWEGKSGTKKLAAFLAVSTTTITQHEKLLSLQEDYQIMVQKGTMSLQTAQDLADVKPDKRAEVLAGAVARQETEQAAGAAGAADTDDPDSADGPGTEPDSEPDAGAGSTAGTGKKKKTAKKKSSGKGKGAASRKTGKIQQRHLRKSIRETEGAVDPEKNKALTRKEIVDYFQLVADSPAYGYPNGAVRTFAQYFCDKWARGLGTDKTLDKHFDEMIKAADRGTADSVKDPIAEDAKETKIPARKSTGKAKKQAKKKK